MQNQNPLDEPLGGADGEFERALGKLSPIPGAHSTEQIAFEAGRRAGQRSTFVWRGVSTALAASLALAVFLRPSPRVVDRMVYVQPETQFTNLHTAATESSGNVRLMRNRDLRSSYLSMRDDVLDHGLDVLKPAGTSSPRTPTPQAIDVQPYELRIPGLFGGNS